MPPPDKMSQPDIFMKKKQKIIQIHQIVKKAPITMVSPIIMKESPRSLIIKKKVYKLPPKTMFKRMLAQQRERANTEDLTVSGTPTPYLTLKLTKEPIEKEQPVAVDPSGLQRKPFFAIANEVSKQAAYRACAIDVCSNWGWPESGKLDRRAALHVHNEVKLLEEAATLSSTEEKSIHDIKKLVEQREAALVSEDRYTEFKIQEKQTKLEDGLKQIRNDRSVLTKRCDESYAEESAWEGIKPTSLWKQTNLSNGQRESNIQSWDKTQKRPFLPLPSNHMGLMDQDKQRRQPARKTKTPRAPLQRVSNVARNYARPARAHTTIRSSSSSPPPMAGSRKRKLNPIVDYVKFDEDSEGGKSDDDRFEANLKALDEKGRRLSDENAVKSAPRKLNPHQRKETRCAGASPASAVSENENKRAEKMEEAAKEGMKETQTGSGRGLSG